MVLTIFLGAVTLLSMLLLLWQFVAAMRFPLHQRIGSPAFLPAVTVFKPLKGEDAHTAESLRSWFAQDYPGSVRIYFGVADPSDPVCEIVRALLRQFPRVEAELVICAESLGTNAKVSTLIQLDRHFRAKNSGAITERGLVVMADADVSVPPDYLVNAVAPLRDPAVGLVNSFYRMANPTTLAMRWEAIAINADFWSQVLQSNTIKPQSFALGAAMITTRQHLDAIGGFESLVDYLADDYQLGRRISQTGARIELSPVVVECGEAPMNFRQVWAHQLRWARTIRCSQPLPYFLSVLSNVTFWATLLVLFGNAGGFPLVPDSLLYSGTLPRGMQSALASIQVPWVLVAFACCLAARVAVATVLQARLTRRRGAGRYWWLTLLKDYLQFGIWLGAFLGDTVTWRGRKFRVERDGRLRPA